MSIAIGFSRNMANIMYKKLKAQTCSNRLVIEGVNVSCSMSEKSEHFYIFLWHTGRLEQRVHIRVSALSWSEYYNFVCDGRYSERGRAFTPHPYQPGLNLPSWWKYARKWPLPLCVLCGLEKHFVIRRIYTIYIDNVFLCGCGRKYTVIEEDSRGNI